MSETNPSPGPVISRRTLFGTMIAALRPYEISTQNLQNSGVLDAYVVAYTLNQRPQIDAGIFLPGRNWLEFDAEFLVLHRR